MSKTISLVRSETTFMLPVVDLLAAYCAASKEETRYYLRGVFCEITTASEVIITATTGSVAFTRTIQADGARIGELVATQSTDVSKGFILSIDIADKAFKAKARHELWAHGDIVTGLIQVIDFDPSDPWADTGERVGVVEFEVIDGTFPDWRRIMPVEAESGDMMTVDANLLVTFQKIVRIYGHKSITLHPAKSGNPVKVSMSLVPGLTGVIMPMRRDV